MKNAYQLVLTLLITAALGSQALYAQVGINDPSPAFALSIVDTVDGTYDPAGDTQLFSLVQILNTSGPATGINIRHQTADNFIGNVAGNFVFGVDNQAGGGPNAVEAMRLTPNGNLGIGTDAPTERLHVNGNALANAFISPPSATPDYVFQKYFDGVAPLKTDYRMLSLDEVEAFVRANKHLPNVPSAREIAEQGSFAINRATEINLEKIEELFLHTIEQEKKIEAQQTRIETQQAQIDELKVLVQALMQHQ